MKTFEQFMRGYMGPPPLAYDSWEDFFKPLHNHNLRYFYETKYNQLKGTQLFCAPSLKPEQVTAPPKFRIINKKKS